MGEHCVDLAPVAHELIEGLLHAIGAVGGLAEQLLKLAHIGSCRAREFGVTLQLAAHLVEGRLAGDGVEPAIEGTRLAILIAVPGGGQRIIVDGAGDVFGQARKVQRALGASLLAGRSIAQDVAQPSTFLGCGRGRGGRRLLLGAARLGERLVEAFRR